MYTDSDDDSLVDDFDEGKPKEVDKVENFLVLGHSYRVILPRDEPFYPCMPMPGARKAVTKLERNLVVKCVGFEDFLGCASAILDIDGCKVMVARNGASEYLKKVARRN